MNKFLFAFAALSLMACGPGDTDSDTDTDTDPAGPTCETARDQFPAPDAQGVYYRTSISWDFSDVDHSATVTLEEDGGGAVTGTSEWVGTVLVWTPDAPLTPDTTYNLSLSFCDGNETPSSSFTTGPVGTSVTPGDLVNNTYNLDLAAEDVVFIEPPSVGSILQAQLPEDLAILLGVQSADASDILLLGALGEGNPSTQDMCSESIDFPSADFGDNPFFIIGPQTTDIAIAGQAVTIENLLISGAFSPDGSVIAGAVLSGIIDTRPLAVAFDMSGESAICDLAGGLGIDCAACTDGEDFCLSLKITNLNAEKVNGILVPRTTADIHADTTCQEPPAN